MNVAGTNARFSAEEMPAEEFERVIRFNILGTFLACQAVGRVMIEQKRGKIINMSSVRGRVAPDMGGSAYATSKGGVDSADPHPGGGMGQVRHQGERHRTGADHDRHDPRVPLQARGLLQDDGARSR